jgi:hypothetical protein
MMVLCPTHHDEFGSAVPEAKQRTYKSRPYNIQHGLAGGLLRVNQDYCAINLGSLTVVNQGPILSIDGEVLLALRVDEGMLKLSLTVYDREDRLLVLIEDNEWLSGDPLPWDIEALREKARMINLDLNAKSIPPFLAPNFGRVANPGR